MSAIETSTHMKKSGRENYDYGAVIEYAQKNYINVMTEIRFNDRTNPNFIPVRQKNRKI